MSTENDLVAKCPQCSSVFRLTPQHLQAAKGWVQCGMCGNVFHSGLKAAAEEPAAAPLSEETLPSEPALSQSGETVGEQAFTPAADAGTPDETAEPAAEAGAEAAAAGLSGLAQRIHEHEMPSAFGPKLESIILVDPNLPPADDDYGPMPEIAKDKETDRQAGQKAGEQTPASPPPGGWGARQASATSTGWIQRRPAPAASTQKVKKRKLGWLWGVLILLLLLGLAAQLVYHLRDRLASSHPDLRPHLAQMCEALDCVLSLPKDTKQVLILGSDLQTEEDGRLSLEVTLANRASHPMAWPVLELTLTDVEDQPVARRMFAPSEYLPGGMEAAGIQSRTEVPFNLQLQSKGLKAAGYRLRMFY